MKNKLDVSRKAAILPRVSTKEQVGNYSWKNQLDLVELAREDGFTEVVMFEEAGESGEDLAKRPIAQRVISEIETGEYGALYLMNFREGHAMRI